MSTSLRILVVFGTRPEAIKMAPVVLALRARPSAGIVRTCATAQHRDMLNQVQTYVHYQFRPSASQREVPATFWATIRNTVRDSLVRA